ncbi:hypothetical protein ILP92_01495 [Maribius pontilimi]|uniref:Uncharacterized protein n=1 Tax=Palleronia pontilimi TaxID=1964209 RepID=A0A934IDC8_9RHOB|nr:hypothetical protein [Palleronia pontilimi]MBJ3761425.1 hypothetical protein [Palleronia pontilimi]
MPGGTILVTEGGVFIFKPTASNNIRLESASGSLINFSIIFDDSNPNAFDVEIKEKLSPDITIADNVDLGGVFFKADKATCDVTLIVGDNVTNDTWKSGSGNDAIILGDNFVINSTFATNNGDDTITIGENATGSFDTGGGTDTVITRDPTATINNAENRASARRNRGRHGGRRRHGARAFRRRHGCQRHR